MKRTLLIIICIGSIVLFFCYLSGSRAGSLTHGFASYYTFSRILIEEDGLSKAYDTSYFNLKIKDYGIDNIRDQPNNLPTSSLMFLPVARLDPHTAKILWVILSVLLYLASIVLLLNVFSAGRFASDTGLLLISISLLFLPVYHGLHLGQAYVLLLFLLSLSLLGLKKNNDWLIALPLALMLILKGYGVFPLAGLLLMKKWKAFSITVIAAVILILITFLVIGLNSWTIYYSEVLSKLGSQDYVSSTAYQTLNSMLRHLPGMDSTAAAMILLLLLCAGSVFILMKAYTSGNFPILFIYSSFAALNVLFAPYAEDYHYTLLLPLIFGTGKILAEKYKNMKLPASLFIVSLLLISLPVNYKSLNDASFPLILLAYPVLYGGILLITLPAYFHLISEKEC